MAKNITQTPQPQGPSFFDRRGDLIAGLIIFLTAVMALLLFSVRMNEGGDDSTYICKAADFVDSAKYPNFQGPLYPIFLSLFVWLSGGINLLVLKFTSYALIIVGQLVTWLALRRHVSRPLLLSALLLMACNLWFVQFGSLTYSEPLFLVVSWLFVWAVLRVESLSRQDGVKRLILWGLAAGSLVVVAYLVRTVGLGLGLAALLFLAVRRRWLPMASFAGGMVVVLLLWTGVKAMAWPNLKADTHQLETLLQVNPYDPSEGLETPKGYVKRFIGNSEKYLSKHYVKMLGLKDKDSRAVNTGVTVILYLVFLWGVWVALRSRQKAILLVAATVMVMLGMTFFSLQVLWDQYRLILPFVAMMHIVMLYAVADLVRRVAKSKTRLVMGGVVAVLSLSLFMTEAKSVDFKTLRVNLSSDPLYGYTPDWYNYLNLCRVVGEKMKADEFYVACRKPDMARIYSGGKKFYGIYTIPSEDPDVLVDNLRKNGVTHVIVASLRRDPAQAGLGVINTIHRYLYFIIQAYPDFIQQVGNAGTEDNEPAVIYALHYENARPQQK